jgi:hypothetical protein
MADDHDVMQLRARVLELEGKIDFLYRHLQLEYVKEGSEIEKKVAEALKKGNMLEAINIYRNYSQVDLATAKQAVEEIMRKSG